MECKIGEPVKLVITKYSAAGRYNRFFPYGPPWNFYSPFGTPKEVRTIIGPTAEYFLMANFTLHSRNGF